MKIGVDVSSLVYRTGVGDYTFSLVKSLVNTFPDDKFVLYGASLRRYFSLVKRTQKVVYGRKVGFKLYPMPPKLQKRIFNNLHLPIERFAGNVDVFHSWDWYTPGTRKAKLVTTIHDLSAIKFPNSTHPEIVKAHRSSLEWIKKEASAIIAVSESTKEDIVSILKIKRDIVHVIYEALPINSLIKVEKKDITIALKKYSINKPYFIVVASQEPRKNLGRIIEAWQEYKKDFELVLVGKSGYDSIKDQSGLIKTGFVSDIELASLYAGARCLLYPSLYEGFGLPILEAFYYGIPVVTSNLSSMPEVAGEGAVLVDPTSVEDIERGIAKALETSESLVKLGRAQLKKFSWEKVAKETMAVYKKVVNS